MIKLKFLSEMSEEEWNEKVKKLDGNYFFSYEYLNYFEYMNLRDLINKSFILTENNKILSITPFIIFKNDTEIEASFAGSPLLFSLIKNVNDKKKYNEIFETIYKKKIEISLKYNVKKISIRLPKKSENSIFILAQKMMDRFNFKKIKNSNFFSLKSTAELVLNLNNDIGLRKKHSSYVDYTNKKTSFEKITRESFDESLFKMYTKFHNDNKKNKRSDENFQFNKLLILKGMQSIFLCLLDNKIISAVVTVNFNNKVHYNSSVNQIVDKKIYGNFVLLNKAIDFYKNKKFDKFYLGDVVEQKFMNSSLFSKKEINLSRFKKNWNGDLFYHENYFRFF